MRRDRNKGLLLYLLGVALFVLGVAGMIYYFGRLKSYPGQSIPGKELFGTFVLSPAVMIAGIVLSGAARRNYDFVAGTAPSGKVKRRLTAALILSVVVSAALIARLRSAGAVVTAAVLITTAVCAGIFSKNAKAFLKACYLAALAGTLVVVFLLSALPAAPGGHLLSVNGFRFAMSNRSGSILGIFMTLAAGPFLLAWPLALLARGLYELCTWELR